MSDYKIYAAPITREEDAKIEANRIAKESGQREAKLREQRERILNYYSRKKR